MNHLTLYELNQEIRKTLDLNLHPSYWVVAEIGEMRIAQKGHCYLELVEKEEENIRAKIRANIWSYQFRNLNAWFQSTTGESLQPGLKILANVAVTFHEVYGMSLNVKDIDPTYTLGERARKKQQVISRLKEEGVFDMNRMYSLPLVPQRIAVISSPTAAGLGDFTSQIDKNRFGYHFHLELFSAVMQGDEAIKSIIKALYLIHQRMNEFDLLVVIRGGGAQTDLDCFDNYELASHIAQFPLPVLTGIGHERDETVVDLVAHTKLKTPTAVAEFVIGGVRLFEENLLAAEQKLVACTNRFIKDQDYKLKALYQVVRFGSRDKISRQLQRIDQLKIDLQKCPRRYLERKSDKINHLARNLSLLDPKRVLERGFTITKLKGKLLKDVGNINSGDLLYTITHKEIIESKVQKIHE